MKSVPVTAPKLIGDRGRVAWVKRTGDVVAPREAILDLDFGYAKVPVPSPIGGRIQQTLVPEGGDVGEGDMLAMLELTDVGRKPLDLCSSCGVARVAHKARCAHCHAAHPAQPLEAPRDTDTVWACVECTFRCRGCGFAVPLDRVATDGKVECARCGLEQAFDSHVWRGAFEQLHAVADGMVPGIGTDRISWQHTFPPPASFEVTASPGHPLCPACHTLLVLAKAEGHATVSCATCKMSDPYDLPAAASRLSNRTLAAIVATEHRSDHPPARVDRTLEAVTVRCPACGAPLDASGGARVARCTYCQASCRIPAASLAKAAGKDLRPESMWLAFDGPSHARQQAERTRDQRAHDTLLAHLREKKDEAVGHSAEQAARAALAERVADMKRAAPSWRSPAGEPQQNAEAPSVIAPSATTPAAALAAPTRRGSAATRVAVVAVAVTLAAAAIAVALLVTR